MKLKISIIAYLLFNTIVQGQQGLPFTDTKSSQFKKMKVYSTVENTNHRLTLTSSPVFTEAEQQLESKIYVFVNPSKTFQTFLGMGGAITDASAETFAKLKKDKQQELLNAYYSPKLGIGYSLLRTNIHSCDFSSESYTYITEGDTELKTFNIAHDKKSRIPFIQEAIKTTGGKLTTYASPWSPPAFMKDNKSMLKGGKLLSEYYKPWANYFVKFIKAYEKEGIPIWGLTIQNEPMAVQKWESCIFTAQEERDFLKYYLGPTLAEQGLNDKKIIVWDHNRDFLSLRAEVIFGDTVAAKYAWGIGMHWYENWSGGINMYDNVAQVHQAFPDKNILFTEGCVEGFNSAKYQLWANGERYGKAIINDFNNGTVGWTDWNILLDQTGGPNHVGNFCFAPIHANLETNELIYTPSYFYIGHFSKFIRPNAKRIATTTSRSPLLSTSFINEDNTIATIVMNQGSEKINYILLIDKKQVTVEILPHAIQTIVYYKD